MLIVFPTSPISDLRFQSAKKALYAAFSNRSSPVRRLNVAYSRMREPAPAVPIDRIQYNCEGYIIRSRTGLYRLAFRHPMTEIELVAISSLSNTRLEYIIIHPSIWNTSGSIERW